MTYEALFDFQLFVQHCFGRADNPIEAGCTADIPAFFNGANERRLALQFDLDDRVGYFTRFEYVGNALVLSGKASKPVRVIPESLHLHINPDPRRSYAEIVGRQHVVMYPHGSLLEDRVYREKVLRGAKAEPISGSALPDRKMQANLLDTLSNRIRKRVIEGLRKHYGRKRVHYHSMKFKARIDSYNPRTEYTSNPVVNFDLKRSNRMQNPLKIVRRLFYDHVPFPVSIYSDWESRFVKFSIIVSLPE